MPVLHKASSLLSIRKGRNGLVVDWTCTCDFRGTTVERQLCDGVERRDIPCFLAVLGGGDAAATTDMGLQIQRQAGQVTLTFGRTFIEPYSVVLANDEQSHLASKLKEIESQSEDCLQLSSTLANAPASNP